MPQCETIDKVFKIMNLLKENIRYAIKLQAYFKRAAYQDDIMEFFNKRETLLGFFLVLDSIYFELIMTVARFFDDLPEDKHAENTASLPQLKKLLQDNQLLSKIEEHSVKRKTPQRVIENDLRHKNPLLLFELRIKSVFDAQRDMTDVVHLFEEIDKLKGSHQLARIRKIRNELFAHTAIEIKNNNQAKYKYGDAEELLKKTIKLVSLLSSSLENCHNEGHFNCEIQRAEQNANGFWEKIISGNRL